MSALGIDCAKASTMSGLRALRLEIEITDSGIFADHRHAFQIVQQLKEIGVTVAMDRFGTGYLSLSTLSNPPATKSRSRVASSRTLTTIATSDGTLTS